MIVIIPAFNEEESIGEVLDELKEYTPDLDVIVINDGSTDRTVDVVRGKGCPFSTYPVIWALVGRCNRLPICSRKRLPLCHQDRWRRSTSTDRNSQAPQGHGEGGDGFNHRIKIQRAEGFVSNLSATSG